MLNLRSLSLRWQGLAVPVALAAAVVSAHFVGIEVDDAYIIYRYAANIAHGYGFTFNPGERVLGVTTPLYTLLLAALGSLARTSSRLRMS